MCTALMRNSSQVLIKMEGEKNCARQLSICLYIHLSSTLMTYPFAKISLIYQLSDKWTMHLPDDRKLTNLSLYVGANSQYGRHKQNCNQSLELFLSSVQTHILSQFQFRVFTETNTLTSCSFNDLKTMSTPNYCNARRITGSGLCQT